MIDEIIYHYKKLIKLYKTTYPNSIEEFKNSFNITVVTYVKAWFGILHLLTIRIDPSRPFYFQSFRHQELIDLIPPEKVVIFGGFDEKKRALKKKYDFFWVGGIVAAIILAGENDTKIPLRLQALICKWRFKSKEKFFFLYEDTLPVGVFFSLLGVSCRQSAICVHHGYGIAKDILFLEGNLARYNFLYSIRQKEFITNNSSCFELGPPFDIRRPVTASNEVILVGTGMKSLSPFFYEQTLQFYSEIKNQLCDSMWRVLYRPHPNENLEDYAQFSFELDTRSKVDCLSDYKKVFVGYISTLLYEGKVFGHGAININDESMPELAYDTDRRIEVNEINSIRTFIEEVHDKINRENIDILPPLKERFFSIFNQLRNELKR